MSKKNEVILSIGLIVKNEEENLARCLDSLEDLMKAVPCQLIITDTGSTDKTVEIAKKYTDEVYAYEWCDDFAAARNFGLEKAKGKWFMFIDADEWFEDTKELKEFFITGEYKNYKNATYIVRNYVNSKDKNHYEDQNMGRLYEIREATEFKGTIHEYIPLELPIKELKTFVNHYGYAVDNAKAYKELKHQRNLKLILRECEKDSDNCRFAYLLAKQYLAGGDNKIYTELVRKFYFEHEEDYENEYLPYFTYQLALIYKEQGNPRQGIEILKKYKKNQKNKEVWDLDILVALVDLCIKDEKFKEAVRYGKEYFKAYELYKKGEIPTGISGIVTSPTFVNDESAITAYNLMINAYIQLENVEQALEVIDSLDLNIIIREDLKNSLNLFLYIVFSKARWELVPGMYIKILKTSIDEKIYMFIEMLEKNIVEFLPAYEGLAKEFHLCQGLQAYFGEDDYVILQKLRFSMMLKSKDSKVIAGMFLAKNKEVEINPIFAEFVLFALAIPEYTDAVLQKIDVENLHLYTHKLVSIYSNLQELLVDLFSGWNGLKLNKSTRFNYWIICLMEIILVSNRQADVKVKKELIDVYLEKSYEYMSKIYNNEILCENEISILPRTYRFIYYANEAKKAIKKADKQGYVLFLKKAVTAYPIMVNVVELLLDSIDENEENNKLNQMTNKIEFDCYAKSVKNKIKEIAEDETLRDEAIKLLGAYSKINPKDEGGIAELRLLLRLDN